MMNYRLVAEYGCRRSGWVLAGLLVLALPVAAETLLEQLAAEKVREAAQLDEDVVARKQAEALRRQREEEKKAEEHQAAAEAVRRQREAEEQRAVEEANRQAEQARLASGLPPGHYALTVNPMPEKARVRVMNIKETYKPGIGLKPGEYRIRVDHPGHVMQERRVSLGEVNMTVDITLAEIPMVRVKKGCFQMGQTGAEKSWLIEQSDQETYDKYYTDEKQHEVCLEKDFMMAKYEVTVGEFRAFVEATGYRTDAEKNTGGNQGCRSLKDNKWQWVEGRNWKQPGFQQQQDHPVVCVSWNDAFAYTQWLSQKTEKKYDLPTEAQWEFAARAGTDTFRYWGDDKSNQQACLYANVAGTGTKINWNGGFPCRGKHTETASVGSYRPNDSGLHDMLGNVWEWTCSAYVGAYDGSERECVNRSDTGVRVLRGGSWSNVPWDVRSAYRDDGQPSYRGSLIGFRLSRTP